MRTMGKWRRISGTKWHVQINKHTCVVYLARGGWYYDIKDEDSEIVLRRTIPTRRSRKAHKQAQRVMFRLSKGVAYEALNR